MTDRIAWYSPRYGSGGQVSRVTTRRRVGDYVIEGADVRSYLVDDRGGHPLSVVTVHDTAGKASLLYEFTEE